MSVTSVANHRDERKMNPAKSKQPLNQIALDLVEIVGFL
jgi:hypothetical protein